MKRSLLLGQVVGCLGVLAGWGWWGGETGAHSTSAGSAGVQPPARLAAIPTGGNCGWALVSSPSPGQDANSLQGVAALAGNDVWAVGVYNDLVCCPSYTLTAHWDGSAWTQINSPNPSTGENSLVAVAALASNDVWAVGYSEGTYFESLTEHWNGSQWQVVPSPLNPTSALFLTSVAAAASNDVWAVGYTANPSGGAAQTLIQHWNGSTWAVVPSPNSTGVRNILAGVTALAANNVWAVGSSSAANGQTSQTLIEHWNGSQWQVVPSPNPGTTNALGGVAGTANDLWAVGATGTTGGASQPLTLHWTGSAWVVVANPPLSGSGTLNGVDARTSSDVWAVGKSYSTGGALTLVEHWDGAQWREVFSPTRGTGDGLTDVAVIGASDVWAVGDSPGAPWSTITMHYSGPCPATATPSPAPSRTMTPIYSPTATPTGCWHPFTDVDVYNPFAIYIRCLGCLGIVTGYADGSFRPANPVTRGQVSKITANAAGLADPIPSTQQTFTDVSYGSPFWLYIERLAGRGAIAGYTDPAHCPAGAPCFLPAQNVTRGQLAKIAANTAGYSDVPGPGAYSFADVLPGDPFWLYIQRLARRGIIDGYSCGAGESNPCTGQAEECDPASRPYYRPCAMITRGQTVKVVANTFFPLSCTAGSQRR